MSAVGWSLANRNACCAGNSLITTCGPSGGNGNGYIGINGPVLDLNCNADKIPPSMAAADVEAACQNAFYSVPHDCNLFLKAVAVPPSRPSALSRSRGQAAEVDVPVIGRTYQYPQPYSLRSPLTS